MEIKVLSLLFLHIWHLQTFYVILQFVSLMNLELNWKQIVLKVQSSNQKLGKSISKQEKQLHQRFNHQLHAQLKLRDSISKKVKMQKAQMKAKLQEQMKDKRNKSQAIQAAKLQQLNQYQLHSRYMKQSQYLIKNTEVINRSKSFIDEIKSNKLNHSIQEEKPLHNIDKQGIKVDKLCKQQTSNSSIINMQKLYDSCIKKNTTSIKRQKQHDHIRNTAHPKTQQNQLVSPIMNQYVTSSDQSLTNKPVFQESIRIYLDSRNSHKKSSLDEKREKKKRQQYMFFREAELQVKGKVKKIQNLKNRSKSNKLMKSNEEAAQSQYSNLLKSNLK